jgi:hypothetical protein
VKLAALLILLATGASAQTGRVAGPAASSFPRDFTRTVQLSLEQEPFYGSNLLNDFRLHLETVLPMQTPDAVKRYLETAVASSPHETAVLKASLGREPLAASRASALLLANGLARPDQFRDIVENLEAAKTGLGFKVTDILKDVAGQGGGHPEFARLLRTLGERSRPVGQPFIYDAKGRLERIFDGAPDRTDADDRLPSRSAEVYDDLSYDPSAKPRRSGLALPPSGQR